MKFDGLPSTNYTIGKYLAKENDVYYIEHPYTIKEFCLADKSSPEFGIRKNQFSILKDGVLPGKKDNMNIVIAPPILPTNYLPGWIYNIFYKINEQILLSRIKKLLKSRSIKDFIFINFYDFLFPSIGRKIGAKLNIYYSVDPIPIYHEKHGVKGEEAIVKDSDLVICTSKALFDDKRELNKHTYFVPNASDLVLSSWKEKAGKGDFLNGIPSPIVGYVGAIERRIDYELLEQVIRFRPEYSFVFVGPLYKNYIPNWFFEQKNVHFLPPVSYENVPDLIVEFDVCMIPFKKDALSKYIFPLKLFEYLGLGKPVVLTDFNMDIRENTGDAVEYAKDAEAFCKAIDSCIKNNSEDKISNLIQLAQENTWKVRAEKLMSIIKNHL